MKRSDFMNEKFILKFKKPFFFILYTDLFQREDFVVTNTIKKKFVNKSHKISLKRRLKFH